MSELPWLYMEPGLGPDGGRGPLHRDSGGPQRDVLRGAALVHHQRQALEVPLLVRRRVVQLQRISQYTVLEPG